MASIAETTTREIVDELGRPWRAVALDAIVAHGKPGAMLAFVPLDQPDAPPLTANVTFNSHRAAAFALRTIGDKELVRRLTLAKAAS